MNGPLTLWGPLGAFWDSLGASWASWGQWKRLEAIIKPHWAAREARVGGSWACLGALLGPRGASRARLGAFLGPSWGV